MSKLYCYEIQPIDKWAGMTSMKDMLVRVKDEPAILNEMLKLVQAEAAFRMIGWDGDVREGPYFFVLPDPGSWCVRLAYILKQDHSGMCFLASPFPLPYLECEEENRTILEVRDEF